MIESGQDGRDVPAVMVSTELPSKTAESPTLTPVNTRVVPTEEIDQPLAGSAPGSAAGMECNDALGCVEIGPEDPLWLASALVISGPNSDLGLDEQNGMELAIDFREQLLGHTIELQAEDDGCSAEGGQIVGDEDCFKSADCGHDWHELLQCRCSSLQDYF